MLIPILFSVFYLLACFGVATAAQNKKVDPQKTFHIAVLLTPVVALFVVALSSKKQISQLHLSHCNRCGFEYSERQGTCPACEKEGITIFAKKPIKHEVSLK